MNNILDIFVIVLASWQVCQTQELSPQEYIDECITELNLDRNEIVTLHSQVPGPEVSPKYNSFIHCFFKKTHVIDDKGVVDYNKIIDVMITSFKGHPSDVTPEYLAILKAAVSPGLNTCKQKNPTGVTAAETSVKAFNCVEKYFRQVA